MEEYIVYVASNHLEKSSDLRNFFLYEEGAVDLKRKGIKECILSDLQKHKFSTSSKLAKVGIINEMWNLVPSDNLFRRPV